MKRVWLLIAILLLSGCTTLVSGDTLSGDGQAEARVAYEGETLEIGTNETRIAKLLVQQWMDSPEHRENLLDTQWKNEGIGVVTVDKESQTKLYVTQNFC